MVRFYYLIDEDEKDGNAYAKALSTPKTTIEYCHPEVDIAFLVKILNRKGLAGMILDFKLSYGDLSIKYDAPMLAGHIREQKPNIPVVVLSGVITGDPESGDSYRRTEQLFDWCLDKTEVSAHAAPAQRQIATLEEGYRRLVTLKNRCKSSENAIARALNIQDDPGGLISWLAAESKGEPYLVARLIIHQLLHWSGPLLPLKYAAVFLGVSYEDVNKLQKAIQPAVYRGVFSDLYDKPRYWAHSLAECILPKRIKPAVCTASGGKANIVCDVCGDPFNSFYTVGVKPVGAASPVESGRVCGICLRGEPEDFTVRPESQPLVENVIAETKAELEKNRDGKNE